MKTRHPSPRSEVVAGDDRAAASLRDHVIICGLGNLGFRIFNQLNMIGVPLLVVDPRPDAGFARRIQTSATLLTEDARLDEVLAEAGIATAGALITTFDDDLVNLEVALNAVRQRPDVRVVMRFFNIDLAAMIHAALPNVRVLSLSALASPAFVTAATGPYTRNAMFVDDQMLSVDEIPLTHTGTLERLTFGNAVVLAWQRAAAPPLLFPAPDQPVAAGDRLTVIGPEADVRALPRLLDALPDTPRPPGRARGRLLRRGLTLLRNLDRALYLTLAVLGVVIATSMGVYALARGIPPLDALVLVVGVISTTGIGWSSDAADPTWLKLYSIGLMVTGTAVVAVIYAFVTNYIVSVKLSGLLGQQPVTLRDHVVLCGLGTVGYRVLNGLRTQEEPVAVLEQDSTNRFLPLVRAGGPETPVVVGDARLHESLTLANVAAARCIICATSDDMANIQTALNARQINPRIRVVLRAFDVQTAQQVAETFGFEVALSASALAAPTFVAAALGQSVTQAFRLAGQELSVARLVVPAASPLAGRPLGDLLAGLGARVLSYTPAGAKPYYRPRPTARLGPGDALLVIAQAPALREIARRLAITHSGR